MKKTILSFVLLLSTVVSAVVVPVVNAQPYGAGSYDSNVPYGNQTSLSMTSGNVTIRNITPDGQQQTGTSIVTITSTDVVGVILYVRSLTSTNMDNLGTPLPTSTNLYTSPGPLAVDTWGYNIDGSNNFAGMQLTDVMVKTITGPASSGNTTTFTYGIKVDLLKPAGNYTTSVIYTAVPRTQ